MPMRVGVWMSCIFLETKYNVFLVFARDERVAHPVGRGLFAAWGPFKEDMV